MPPALTFTLCLLILIVFAWYLGTDSSARKRALGLLLAVVLTIVCAIMIPRIQFGLDLKGGVAFLVRLVKDNPGAKITKSMQDQATEVIRSRVDAGSTRETVISPVGADQILVQVPGLTSNEIATTRTQLQQVAKLDFRLVHPQSSSLIPQIEAGMAIVPPGYQIMTEEPVEAKPATDGNNLSRINPLMGTAEPTPATEGKDGKKKEGRKELVKIRPDLDGAHVTSANATYETHGWGVNLGFDAVGTKQFGDLTAAHVKEQLGIVLDGKLISAPVLQVPIYDGRAVISGNFTDAQARGLSSSLENPLSTPVKIDEERSVSPTLGSDYIRRGVLSGIIGLLLTFAFVLVYYRFAGVLACISLLINIVLLLGLMAMFNFVLTLPGIAGVILTIGLAIDANVLVYERLREELAAGKPLRAAVEGAYDKAFSSIFDANITTLITSVILFWQAAGPVKGFAVALTLGIIASLFSALVVTRNGFAWSIERFGLKSIRMRNLLGTPNFNFMKYARVCVFGSLAVILLSIGVFVARGKHNFGIDFIGGDLSIISTAKKLETGQVRDALVPIKLQDSVIQSEEKNGQQLLTIRSTIDTGVQVQKQLMSSFPDSGIAVAQYDKVGALVGKRLAYQSLYALLLGIGGVLIYISLRFEFSFAVGAVVALLHDVIITIGVFAIFGREMSLVLVGAILTIAGYSINDTIVVYDRIRSGLREGRKGSVSEIMNASINETLGRTILTGGATLVTVLALLIGGGSVLNDFAFTLFIGVMVGTYSSIFIAAPIVLMLSRGEKGRLRQEVTRADRPKEIGTPAQA